MSKREDRDFLVDMIIACERIMEYIKDISYEEFCKDNKTVDAVVRNIEILGEACKNISDNLKRKHPEVEWHEIAKTRDKVIHFYFGVDLSIIWDISTIDIPKLHKKLKEILRKEGWNL